MSKKRERDSFDTMGVVLSSRGVLVYGHGFGHFRWAPRWVRDSIVKTWNFLVCGIFVEHFIIDYRDVEREVKVRLKPEDRRIVCTQCCKLFSIEEYEEYLRLHGKERP